VSKLAVRDRRREIMSGTQASGCACTSSLDASDQPAALGAADWLSLAAAPAFAIMALLTGISGGRMDMFCSAASPLEGMTAMYVLMSAFHSVPWLKLMSRRRSGAHLS
jgi:hypothetical protein